MTQTITYLDNNATTRPDPRVVQAMTELLTDRWGNPSSAHHFGAQVAVEVEQARRNVAELIGARPTEIIFTSGGTEADNTALRGVLGALPEKQHLIISPVEHHAIFETAETLEPAGTRVTRLDVDHAGRLNLDQLRNTLTDDTALVSIMLANNETGVIFPIRQITEIAHQRNILVHTDAVNALGKIPVNVTDLGVDLLSLSSHKIYGPKGVGALYLRHGTPFKPYQIGGTHERSRRGGTLNAPGIVALGTACQILHAEMDQDNQRIADLRQQLETLLRQLFPDLYIVGHEAPRLPNTICACFAGLPSEPILILLSEAGICVSSGSACTSGSLELSHVLEAMHVDPHVGMGQMRFSLGRFNTTADLDRLAEHLPTILNKAATTPI